jgi:two-component system phosphate regulon response regulator PhoB
MKKKILIVDDEDSIRRLVAVTLQGGDYDVLLARDGVEALEVALRERPVLVLLDVSMPGLDGVEVCRRIKADPTLRGATVVMLTAQAQADVQRRATAAGADAFLTKPFSPLQVLELVERKVSAGQ